MTNVFVKCVTTQRVTTHDNSACDKIVWWNCFCFFVQWVNTSYYFLSSLITAAIPWQAVLWIVWQLVTHCVTTLCQNWCYLFFILGYFIFYYLLYLYYLFFLIFNFYFDHMRTAAETRSRETILKIAQSGHRLSLRLSMGDGRSGWWAPDSPDWSCSASSGSSLATNQC